MSGMEIHEVGKGSVRMSEMEWRQLIHTGRDWEVWMRERRYL